MPTRVGRYVAAARQYPLNTVMTAGRSELILFNPACKGAHGSVRNCAPLIPSKLLSPQARGVDRCRGGRSRYRRLTDEGTNCDRSLIRPRLQEFFRLPQIKVFRHWFEIRPGLVLLLADRLEQQHASRDVNIDKPCFPMRRADLGSLDLKRTAFEEPTKDPESKINILN